MASKRQYATTDKIAEYSDITINSVDEAEERITIAEEMIAEGVRWRQSDRSKGSRTAGFNRLHELLKVDDQFTLEPGIQVFSTCRQIIAQIPALPGHPNGMDDIDDKFPNDHIYDALRYGIMTRPSPHGSGFGTYQSSSVSDGSFGY